jgi:sulfatase maturation enzyme AslB (radical SAM superfamily)
MKSFKLIVNSSEQCNLRCVYCYESFTHGHMRPETAAAALAAMTPEERAKELIKASMTFGTSLDDLMKRK